MESIKFIGKCLLIKPKKTSKKRILVVGDLHLGYEESLNQSGVFISRKMFGEMLLEFNEIFKRAGKVDYIILLGDVKHEFSRNLKQEWGDVLNLLDYFHKFCAKIIIIRGNHDNYLKTIVSKREFVSVADYFIIGDICFLHGDKDYKKIYNKNIKHWIIGHVHPAITLRDSSEIKTEKYKCFLVGNYKKKEVILVPSFFSYSEGSDPRDNKSKLAWEFNLDNFRVYIISRAEAEAFDFGILKNLK